MFLRNKKVNGNLYCYLVESIHTPKGPRQKVKSYLGRVFSFEVKKNVNVLSISNKECKEIVNDLIKYELIKHGFKEKGNLLINQQINFDGQRIYKGKKEVVIAYAYEPGNFGDLSCAYEPLDGQLKHTCNETDA